MPQSSDAALLKPTVWLAPPPVDATSPAQALSAAVEESPVRFQRSVTLLVPAKVVTVPTQAAALIMPPVVVLGTLAVTLPEETAMLVTGEPIEPTPV
jgi:hypothetical protein